MTFLLRYGRVMGVAYPDAEMRAYYAQGKERDRLATPKGVLELVRTQEILLRRLPAAPAVVADIGGGPGRYAVWLAELGYEVEHRDVMDLHVEQLTALGHLSVRTAVGDARSLNLSGDNLWSAQCRPWAPRKRNSPGSNRSRTANSRPRRRRARGTRPTRPPPRSGPPSGRLPCGRRRAP